MSKPVRGLGKGLGALLGDTSDLNQLRKPVGYVNKEANCRVCMVEIMIKKKLTNCLVFF